VSTLGSVANPALFPYMLLAPPSEFVSGAARPEKSILRHAGFESVG
jgi:hypothetical protein